MPAKKKPARDRLDLRIEPEMSDAIVEAARRDGSNSVSAYVRRAILERLERDKIEVKWKKAK